MFPTFSITRAWYSVFFCVGIAVLALSVPTPAWSGEDFKIAVFPDDQSDKDLVLTGELKKPNGKGPFPAVVLLHTCGGAHDHFKEFWPEYLNSIGYVTLAVDSFDPRGFERCNRKLFNIKGKNRLARDRYFARDAYGALDFLAKQTYVDKNRVAVMGLSFGAITTNYLAGRQLREPGNLNFVAAIGMYGYCRRLKVDGKMIPLALIHGDQERWLKDSRKGPGCKRYRDKGKVELHILPNTYHGFDNPKNDSLREDRVGNEMLYSEKATETAKRIIKDFLARHLKAK